MSSSKTSKKSKFSSIHKKKLVPISEYLQLNDEDYELPNNNGVNTNKNTENDLGDEKDDDNVVVDDDNNVDLFDKNDDVDVFKGAENYEQYINTNVKPKSDKYVSDDVDNDIFVPPNIKEMRKCYDKEVNVNKFNSKNDIDKIGDLVLSKSGELLKRYLKYEDIGEHHIHVYDNWVYDRIHRTITDRILVLSN